MFSLAIVELQSPGLAWGEITIGEFSEWFEMDMAYWSPSKYRRQWRDAASRITIGDGRSAFITSMPKPNSSEGMWWWPAWREGERVFIQNQLVRPEQRARQFDGSDPTTALGPPSFKGVDGYGISTWETTVTAIGLFAQRLQKSL